MTAHVHKLSRTAVSIVMAASIAVSAINLAAPSSAAAAPKKARTINRRQVIERGANWVKRRVPYSQSRYKNGYRTDCSGFVSMAWQTGTSYTTRSMGSVSKRISVKNIRPGDAVLAPGHIVLFVKWKNKRARTFVAYEQPGSGKTARKRIIKMRVGSKVLRRDGIKETPKPKKRPKRKPARPAVTKPVTTTLDPAPRSDTTVDTATPTSEPATPTAGALTTSLIVAMTPVVASH